jgi:hypothetical protein
VVHGSDNAADKRLTAAARRALREAEQRRKARAKQQRATVRELGGRDGPEPTRFGDWEKNGIISDF